MALTLQDMNPFRIARYIGHATKDVGALCASIKVNRWCPHRPIAAQQDEDLTDVQRQALNWGYNIIEYQDLPSLLTAARAIGPGMPCWTSTRPSHASCPHFRIHDFIGYDHKAEPPFPWNKPQEGKTFYRSGKLRFSQGQSSAGTLTQSQFPLLNDNGTPLKIGVAIRKKVTGSTSNAPSIFVTFTGNTTDFGVDPSEYIINAGTWLNNSNDGDETYEGCLFFTNRAKTLEGQADTAKFYMLPYGYFTFVYNNATGIQVSMDNLVRNPNSVNKLVFDFHVVQLGDVQPVTGIRLWCLAKSAEHTDWECVSGVYQKVGGGGLQANDSADGGITPATVQNVNVSTVNVASYDTTLEFAIDGNDFPSSYIIVCEYSVNGYTYYNDGIYDDSEGSVETTPPL